MKGQSRNLEPTFLTIFAIFGDILEHFQTRFKIRLLTGLMKFLAKGTTERIIEGQDAKLESLLRHDCQMAKAIFLDCMCLALQAS